MLEYLRNKPMFQQPVLDKHPLLAEYAARVGNTSLIEVKPPEGGARIFAKAEWENPHGTVKDRVALAMIWSALSDGLDPETDTILEYSGGQLSVSLAYICSMLCIRSVIVLSDATPASLIEAVRSYGSQLHLVPKNLGFWGVMQRAVTLADEDRELHFLYQHTNPANLAMHEAGTGEEILQQLPVSNLDAWAAAIGTGGTLIGVGRRLHARFPQLRIYGVTPTELPYGSESPPNGEAKFAGSGGLGLGRKQPFVDGSQHLIKGHFHFSYEAAQEEMYRVWQESKIRIGSSAAANLLAARTMSAQIGSEGTIATVFPSAGSSEEWEAVERRFGS